jgi:hypothetical protein
MNYLVNSIIPIFTEFAEDEIGITGANIYLKIKRQSDNYYYDFSDNSFKETPITDNILLTDNSNGYYTYTFDTNLLSKDLYTFIYDWTYETLIYHKEEKAQTLNPNEFKADVSSLALEATSQSILTKVNTLENYDDTTLQNKIDIIDTNIDSIKSTVDTNLDVKVSTRLASSTYEAPDNGSIGAIKNDTDNILINQTTQINKLNTIIADIAALNNVSEAAIWDYLTTNISVVGSIGKQIKDNLDVTIGSRLATSVYTAPDNIGIAYIKNMIDYIESVLALTKGTVEDTNTKISVYNNYKADVSNLATEANVNTLKPLIQDVQDVVDDTNTTIKVYNNYKADVSGLAQESSVQTAITKIDAIDISEVKNIVEDTNTTVKVYDNYKANVSSLALQTTLLAVKNDIATLESNLSLMKGTVEDTNTVVKVYDNYKADISGLAQEATINSVISLINNLNNISTADIWNYLKSNITTTNSIGKFIVDSLTSIINSLSSQNNVSVAEIWDYVISNINTPNSIGLYIVEYLYDNKVLNSDTNTKISNYNNYKADVSSLALESSVQTIKTNTENIETKIDTANTNIDGIILDNETLINNTNEIKISIEENINLLLKYKRILNVQTNKVELFDDLNVKVAEIELSETSVTQTQIFRMST